MYYENGLRNCDIKLKEDNTVLYVTGPWDDKFTRVDEFDDNKFTD